MTAKTGAIYARYSTDLQEETSVDDQFALADRWAGKNDCAIPGDLRFADYAKSGGTTHGRVGFGQMMAAAEHKQFSILIIESLSRLSRNIGDIHQTIERLQFLGVEVIEASSGTKLDDMNTALKGMVSHFMRGDTARMVRRGLHGVVASGKSAGGRAYGYRSLPRGPEERARGGVLVIVIDEAGIVLEIFTRYAGGETPCAIARDLNRRKVRPPRGTRWSASCIHGETSRGSGILNNELYRGWRVWNKNRMVLNPFTGKRVSRHNPLEEHLRCEVPELRILPDSLWDAVASKKAQRSNGAPQRARRAQRVFSGLLRCGSCGAGMSLKGKDRSGRERVQCTRAKESGDCPDPRSYYIEEIEQRVLGLLRGELEEPAIIAEALDAYEAEMKRLRVGSISRRSMLERELAKVSARADHLNGMLMNQFGDPIRIISELKSVLLRENELKLEFARAEVPAVVTLHPSARRRYLAAVTGLHEALGADGESDPAKVIREVVETVVLHPVGPSRNRHTAAPRIEIVGRLERLLGERFIMPAALGGINGSGGGISTSTAENGRNWRFLRDRQEAL